MKSVPSENMVALRKLTAELSKDNSAATKTVVNKITETLNDGYAAIKAANTNKIKIKCYENIFTTITNLLNEIKLT